MTRMRTMWVALGAAVRATVTLVVRPVGVVPTVEAQTPGFPSRDGTVDRSGLEPGATHDALALALRAHPYSAHTPTARALRKRPWDIDGPAAEETCRARRHG